MDSIRCLDCDEQITPAPDSYWLTCAHCGERQLPAAGGC